MSDDPERDPLYQTVVWAVAVVLVFLLLAQSGMSVRVEFVRQPETQGERSMREMDEFVQRLERGELKWAH